MTGPTSHFSLLLWLRWHIFVNSLRSRTKQAELMMGVLGYGIVAMAVLGSSFGFFFATYTVLSEGRTYILEILLWVVFLAWQLIPVLFEGYSPGLNFREVARYPVSFPLYVLLNAAYGLFDPAAIASLFWLASIWLAVAIARPSWAPWAAFLFGVFAVLNLLCNRIVVGVFERFQSTRRGREMVAAALLLLMLLPQMFNLAVNGWIRVHRFHPPQWIRDAFVTLRRFAPPRLIVESMGPWSANALLCLALLLLYPILAALLQCRQLHRVYSGEIYTESFRVNRELKIRPGWRFPGMDESTSAIFEKELRYLRQSSRLLITLAYPLALFAFMLFGGPGKRAFPFAGGSNLLGFFAAVLALSIANLAYNIFGMDRDGFGRWLLSPLPLERVMRIKNLAHAALISAIYAAGAIAMAIARGVPSETLVTVTAGFFCVAILQLAVGNVVSVYWPKRVEFTQVTSRSTSSAAGFASLLVIMPVMIIGGMVVFITSYAQVTWLPMAAGFTGLVIAVIAYHWLTQWAVRHAEENLEQIAGELGV